jgi:hypothetical protein
MSEPTSSERLRQILLRSIAMDPPPKSPAAPVQPTDAKGPRQ